MVNSCVVSHSNSEPRYQKPVSIEHVTCMTAMSWRIEWKTTVELEARATRIVMLQTIGWLRSLIDNMQSQARAYMTTM